MDPTSKLPIKLELKNVSHQKKDTTGALL